MQPQRIIPGHEAFNECREFRANSESVAFQYDTYPAREFPAVLIGKHHLFETSTGRCTLAQLFDGRQHLIVYHFSLGTDVFEGCNDYSSIAEYMDDAAAYLAQRDVTAVAISTAPLARIERARQRMRWKLPWVSSHGGDFDYDHVPFAPAKAQSRATRDVPTGTGIAAHSISVFYQDEWGDVFHIDSCRIHEQDLPAGIDQRTDLISRDHNERSLEFAIAWARQYARDAAHANAAAGTSSQTHRESTQAMDGSESESVDSTVTRAHVATRSDQSAV